MTGKSTDVSVRLVSMSRTKLDFRTAHHQKFITDTNTEMTNCTKDATNRLTLPVVGVDDELSESRFRDWMSLML